MSLTQLLIDFNNLLRTAQHNFWFVATLVGILWGIHIINALLGYRLNWWGIYPRHARGLIGIIFSPFLHRDINHLLLNSVPLFVLLLLLPLGLGTDPLHYKFYVVTVLIVIIGGFLLWLVGRRGIHIGASSLVMGYWGFLLANAYWQRTALAILLAVLCLYYLGGLVVSLFPSSQRVSWEGHVCGFLGGAVSAYSWPIVYHMFF